MKKFLLISALGLVGLVTVLVLGFVTLTSVRFARERRATDAAWQASTPEKLSSIGSVKRLRILPLVEGAAASADLRRGIGVSYLIQADDTTILCDVAGNPAGEPLPPVATNAAKLGVDLGAVQAIFISHLHPDHVGDLRDLLAVKPLGDRLKDVPIYLPQAAPTGKEANPIIRRALSRSHGQVLDRPTVIAPGVASLGPIAKTYWGMGTIVEQALAVNVEGKGVVIVVGCGHQSVERILARALSVIDAPIHGIVGGLHLPVTGLPGAPKLWSFLTRLASTGEQPWHGPLGKADVGTAIELIRQQEPGVVGLSPHDSSPWTLDAFRAGFGDRYRDVEAGREIVVRM